MGEKSTDPTVQSTCAGVSGSSLIVQGTDGGEKCTRGAEQGIEKMESCIAKPVQGTCVSEKFSCEAPKRTRGGVQRTCASEKRTCGTE